MTITETTPEKIRALLEQVRDALPNALVPVGSVLSWLKDFTNTPALPSGFVECNGQTLSDADSVYNGQVIPNLNGNNNFLRGASTSGATGGAATVTVDLTHSTTHGFASYSTAMVKNPSTGSIYATNSGSGITSPHIRYQKNISILPPYYNVVWIMRVK